MSGLENLINYLQSVLLKKFNNMLQEQAQLEMTGPLLKFLP